MSASSHGGQADFAGPPPTETATQTNNFVLASPVWSMFHYLLGIILIFYVIQQMLFLLVRPARQGASDEYEP